MGIGFLLTKDLTKYPVSLTHFPSLDRSVTGGTFNQRSTIPATSFVKLTNNGNSQKRTHPILYEKYNLKNKSTKMQCHSMGLHHHLSINVNEESQLMIWPKSPPNSKFRSHSCLKAKHVTDIVNSCHRNA